MAGSIQIFQIVLRTDISPKFQDSQYNQFPTPKPLPAQDVRVCNAIPQWQLNIAWSAIRHAISIDSSAYALTLGLQMGDVKALLRAIRLFYCKTAINEQHQVLSTLRTIMQADYSSLRNYMAALETNFIRLTKLGYTLPTTTSDSIYSRDFRRTTHAVSRVPYWLSSSQMAPRVHTQRLSKY